MNMQQRLVATGIRGVIAEEMENRLRIYGIVVGDKSRKAKKQLGENDTNISIPSFQVA